MVNDEHRKLAAEILRQEKMTAEVNKPPSIGVIVRWKNNAYIGSLQMIAEDCSPEICLLNKSSKAINPELIEAIREIQPDRLQLVADEVLDLEDRVHVMRRVGNRLTICTAAQTEYMTRNMPAIFELQ